MRGRVFSVVDAAMNSAAILSMLPAAWLAQTFGVSNIFLAAGVSVFIIFLIALRKINHIFLLGQKEQNEVKPSMSTT